MHKLCSWWEFLPISPRPRGSSSRAAPCTSAEANGDPLMHDLIDKRNMDSQLRVLLLSFVFIYLILPAATNVSMSVCCWMAQENKNNNNKIQPVPGHKG